MATIKEVREASDARAAKEEQLKNQIWSLIDRGYGVSDLEAIHSFIYHFHSIKVLFHKLMK